MIQKNNNTSEIEFSQNITAFLTRIKPHSQILQISITISGIFFIIHLLSKNIGVLIFDTTATMFAVYLLIGLLLLNIPYNSLSHIVKNNKVDLLLIKQVIPGLLITIATTAICLLSQEYLIQLASIPLFTVGLILLSNKSNRIKNQYTRMSITVSFYIFVIILIQYIPALWNSIQQFSLRFTSVIGVVSQTKLSLGPSISGGWILFGFLITLIGVFAVSIKTKKIVKQLILSASSLFLLWVIYIVLLSRISFASKADMATPLILLFLIGLVPLMYFWITVPPTPLRKLELQKYMRNHRFARILYAKQIWAICLVIIGLLLLTIYIPSATPADDTTPTVAFYGKDMLGNWDIPQYGTYGREATGMFGLLPIYLEVTGYDTKLLVNNTQEFQNQSTVEYTNITRYVNLTDYTPLIETPSLSPAHLDNVDILVIININTSFSNEEKQNIWEYVNDGGSLLVLGDHTNVGGIQQPLNTLLQPTGIQYQFDSALPLDPQFNWATCTQLVPHPVTTALDPIYDLQISVGASLHTPSTATPLIIGKYGLADRGNTTNEEIAYLGDYEYQPGEHLGDLILASTSTQGSGKILVFGDTSSFQNSALPYSYPFITNIFSWLHHPATPIFNQLQPLLAVILLISGLILIIRSYKNQVYPFIIPCILLSVLLISGIANSLLYHPTHPTSGHIAYIDISHNEQFTIQPYTDTSLTGCILNLMRNNYQPLLLKSMTEKQLTNCDLLILHAPTEQLTSSEVNLLHNYMKTGGTIILCTGYNDKDAVMPLLNTVNLDIQNIPLGPVPYGEDDPQTYQNETRFVNSWPITYPQNNNDTYQSFYSVSIAGWDEQYHLMVYTHYGAGGLLLISDSEYLLDKNLESIYDYWPGNILMFKYILDELQNMEEQS